MSSLQTFILALILFDDVRKALSKSNDLMTMYENYYFQNIKPTIEDLVYISTEYFALDQYLS